MAREQEYDAPPRTNRREVVVQRDCKLCKDQVSIDYKQGELLKKFMTKGCSPRDTATAATKGCLVSGRAVFKVAIRSVR